MRPIVLYNQYVLVEPDGEFRYDTITDELMIALYQHLADAWPSSVISDALKHGYKIIKCDIVFTNIKTVDVERTIKKQA